MRADLIDDLRNTPDDKIAPDEMVEMIDSLWSLCEEAADCLEENAKTVEALTNSIKYLNDDPYRVLSRINVNDHIEKKNGLSYLSWAWAWDMLMSLYPDSYASVKRPMENDFPYWTDGHTCWVDVSVTVVWNGQERTRSEVFPIMDYKNKSIPAESVTSFDVNTALQRAWTKCIARHGLGFYIYAGQDLPNEEAEATKKPITAEQIAKVKELYTEAEIETMEKRRKKKLEQFSIADGDKMIAKRDQSLIADKTATF